MAKLENAFTLIELMVVLAITCISLALALPGLGNLIESQRLKYDVNRFKSIVENTRELSARTECNSEVRFTNSQNPSSKVSASISLVRNGSGPCNIWFTSAGVSAYNNEFEIAGTQIQSSSQSYTFSGGGSVVSLGLGQTITFKRGTATASLQVRPEGFSETTFTHD